MKIVPMTITVDVSNSRMVVSCACQVPDGLPNTKLSFACLARLFSELALFTQLEVCRDGYR